MSGQWQSIARRIRVPMGFVIAALFLILARPSVRSIEWSLLLVIPGVALRGYASGYVKKNAELTVTGPYAYTRNPLYLGSILIGFGFALASKSPTIAATLAVFFFVIYVPVIRSEEEFLRSTFPEFVAYCQHVPRLFPRLTPAGHATSAGSFSMALYSKHREYNALLGAISIYAALLLRMRMHS
ncbi:MAG TPA: isoprenylcysteine carboxylmethyltransferase family protein [Acidisarcina sp.]|nr:isoprenylcysteine carboxylmethyltransferase family protein [Acidisarcina sp.]